VDAPAPAKGPPEGVPHLQPKTHPNPRAQKGIKTPREKSAPRPSYRPSTLLQGDEDQEMSLSPEPEEQKIAPKEQKTNNKQVHWKLPELNGNDTATEGKVKEPKKQKERKQKVPEA
jgi:hypothetical protein